MRRLPERLALLLRQLLVSIDQLGQVLIVGVFYVAGLTSACPSADETISSYVGRGELRGARWAQLLGPVIDRLFVLLGEEPGHCRRNVETAACGAAPVS